MQPLLATEKKLGRQVFMTLKDGFEIEGVGDKPALVSIIEEPKGFVAVTDEKACTGKHSLKFVDAAGLEHYYSPHIYYRPNTHASVNMRLSFDLYREPGAMLWVEWRDYVGPRQVGPSIHIEADGQLLLNEDKTPAKCKIPDSTWVHFEMTDALGELADGIWAMKITANGQTLYDRKDLPCDKNFASIQWMGFVSNGVKPAVFYLDNVSFTKCEP